MYCNRLDAFVKSVDLYGNQIKMRLKIGEMRQSPDEKSCRPGNPKLLQPGQRFQASTEAGAAPGFDFNKMEVRIFDRDKINFTENLAFAIMKITRQNFKLMFGIKLSRGLLAELAEKYI